MAQDSAGHTIVPASYNGNYEVVDMNFNDDTKVIQINQLNGRQGDTRTARIKVVQDNQAGSGTVAYSIDGLQPQIVGKDAKGNTIQIAGNWNPINVNLGLFSITAPANVYQAVGLTQGCYLRLVDNGGNVVSSIPVIFEVIQDSSNMTNYEATGFLQSVDSVAQQAIEKFDSANTLAKTANDVANQALATAQQADADAKSNGVLKNSGDQKIDGVLTVNGINVLGENKVVSQSDLDPLSSDNFKQLQVQVANGFGASILPIYYFYMTNPKQQSGILQIEGQFTHVNDLNPYSTSTIFSLPASFPFKIEDNWEIMQGVTNVDAFGVPYWIRNDGNNNIQIHTLNVKQGAANPIVVSVMIHAKYTGGNN